jgi:hypothetical protein
MSTSAPICDLPNKGREGGHDVETRYDERGAASTGRTDASVSPHATRYTVVAVDARSVAAGRPIRLEFLTALLAQPLYNPSLRRFVSLFRPTTRAREVTALGSPLAASYLRGWGMAETEQRFTLHARSRNIARIIGYPAGLGLLAAAVFFPFGDTQERWVGRAFCALVGLGTLLWTWSMDRRRRVEVTEQQVTVVNSFSRYVVAWHELSDVEFERIQNQAGGTAYHRLAFVTPSRRIVAEAPAGSERELMKFRDRILHARESSRNVPQSDVGIAVEGAAAVADRLGARFPRLKEGLFVTGAIFSVAFTIVLGLGFIILVLDLILGDWLVYHVAFWDKLIGFVVENL